MNMTCPALPGAISTLTKMGSGWHTRCVCIRGDKREMQESKLFSIDVYIKQSSNRLFL